MQHRAARPFTDFLLRLPRTAARLLGAAAGRGPARAMVLAVATLTLGGAAYAVVTSVTGDPAPSAEPPAASSSASGSAEPRPRVRADRTGGAAAEADTEPEDPTSDPPEGPRTGSASPSRGGEPDGPPLDTGSVTPTPRAVSPRTTTTTPDDTPPVTSLATDLLGPDGALLSFSADEEATFTCSLDGAAFSDCGSSLRYTDLDAGWHTFAVRATDTSGNVDPTPARTRWHASKGVGDTDVP